MKVTELIDILYKCSPESNVDICAVDDGFEYPSNIVEAFEVINKISDETTVYLIHD